MSQGPFGHDYRLHCCQNCGASLSVALEGGQASCRYCQAVSVWRPRTEVHDIASLRAVGPVDEYARFRQLREQEGRPLLAPPGVDHLMVAGELPVQLLPQATVAWQQALAQVAAGAPFGVHDRLYFLTLLIHGRLTRDGGDGELRSRALVESALETLPSAQHRYLLRSMLARSAARQGDLASADAWLAGCDTHSTDLEVDSEYRMSAGVIATRKGDLAGVLRLLGQRAEDVPVARSTQVVCGLLRVNALERSGHLAAASEQLDALVARTGRDDVTSAHAFNQSLDLCPRTIGALRAGSPEQAQAAREQQQAAADALRQSSSPFRGLNLFFTGVFGLIGLVAFVAGFVVSPADLTDDGHPLNVFLWVFGGCFLLTPFGLWLLQRQLVGRLGADLGATGSPGADWQKGAGQVVAVRPTGWTVNDQPQLEVKLRVFFGARPPYEVDVKLCVPEHQVEQLRPNVSLGLLINPAAPHEVAVASATS